MDDSMIEEFRIEAQEMFQDSEDGFLRIEKGEPFLENYNLIFRAFHSLKGAAGMFGIDKLQSHMHKLESLFEAQKSIGSIDKAQIDYFLLGIDCARELLDGNSIDFKYYTLDEFKTLNSSYTSPLKREEKVIPVKKSSTKGEGLFYIVDDEEDVLEILADLIGELGYQTKTFNNAKELLDNVEIDNPDVIISDIKMPNMTGIDLIHALRDLEIDTPVIFVSGFISKEIMLEGLEKGAFGFIEKPYNADYLQEICRNAFLREQTSKLLQKSINYILYQFSDLDNYLKSSGKDSLRTTLKNELNMILDNQKKLKSLKSATKK